MTDPNPLVKLVKNAAVQILSQIDPGKILPDHLRLKNERIEAGDLNHPFSLPTDNLAVISLGKAGATMAAAAGKILGHRIKAGLCVVRDLPEKPVPGFEIIQGGHPQPDEKSALACRLLEEFAEKYQANQAAFIVLLSGGTSSLISAPQKGFSLEELKQANHWLLNSGNEIGFINAVRRKITRMSGGALAAIIKNNPMLTLAVSDVLGCNDADIGSGPTLPDPSSFSLALKVVAPRGERPIHFPENVFDYLVRGEKGEISEGPDRRDPIFENSRFHVILDNAQAVAIARGNAMSLGCGHSVAGGIIEGEARIFGEKIGRMLTTLSKRHPFKNYPVCFAYGGESTVAIDGPCGVGGRNLEMALAIAIRTADLTFPYAALCFGTDGSDGLSSAAGAVVDNTTCARAKALGLSPQKALETHNTHEFFEKLGDLFVTGPTGTNVADLAIVVAGESE